MVGIGFPERNDSFDFIAALDDFKKQMRITKGMDKPSNSGPSKDYSLKEGEKITVNIPGLTNKKPQESKPASSQGFGGLKKLAPPPGKKPSTTGAVGSMNAGFGLQSSAP